jgi:acetyl esterase/lipase
MTTNERWRVGRAWVAFLGGLVATCGGAESAPPPPDANLQQWLQRFPAADANGDGVLTEAEARAYRAAMRQKKTTRSPAPGNGRLAPTHPDVSYGPHARNVLDLWRAESDQPTPVLLFFHGGSFKGGDKSVVAGRPILRECLQVGISVVSVNYRFSSDAPFPAPMHDGARAVQFVRYKAAEWNLDPERVAASGSSAGATLALWIALHDDLAEPANADPVARQSTRVTCASPHSGTASLELEYFREHAGAVRLGAALWQLFGAESPAELATAEKRALIREASPLRHATRDDPPLFLTYAGDPAEAPFPADASQSAWIHHVSLGLPLQSRYAELGLECELFHRSRPAPAGAEVAFLRRHLGGRPPTSGR